MRSTAKNSLLINRRNEGILELKSGLARKEMSTIYTKIVKSCWQNGRHETTQTKSLTVDLSEDEDLDDR
jgi:hypothetical protein